LGRLCIPCERIRPNEAFGGKGRRACICRKCRQLPREQQDRLLHEREIRGFLGQSHISDKNITRLRALAGSADARIAGIATLVRDVAAVAPYRRRRIRILARQRRDLLRRMEVARLILPRTEWEDCDSGDVDPVAAWYDWAEYAREFAWE
jgi:sugar phosphate isomerase/epimerase